MSVLAYDAFRRKASSGGVRMGPAWTTQPTDNEWTISGTNQYTAPAVFADAAYSVFSIGDSWPNDQYAKATIITITGNGADAGGGLVVRGSTAAQTGYAVYVNDAAGNDTYIIKRVANVSTTLSTTNNGWVAGDVIYLEVVGTTLIVKKNGVQVDTTTDSAIASGNPGLAYYNAAITNFVLSNFEAGDLKTVPTGYTQVNLVKDNFNRPDVTGLGASWTAVTGIVAPDIVGNQAEAHTEFGARYSAITWPNDQYANLTIVGAVPTANTVGTGIAVRMDTSSAYTAYNLKYGGHVSVVFGEYAGKFHKIVAGVLTPYTYFDGPAKTNDIISLGVVGKTIIVKYNNVLVFMLTDSSIASGAAGVIGDGGIPKVFMDNFEGGMLLAGESLGYIQQNKLRPRIFGPGIAR